MGNERRITAFTVNGLTENALTDSKALRLGLTVEGFAAPAPGG